MTDYTWVGMVFTGYLKNPVMLQVATWCNENRVIDFRVVRMRYGYVEIVAKVEIA